MISPRIYIFIALLMLILPVHGINYVGSLTGSECKAYFESDDVNKNLQALFSCPKKWRPKSKKRISRFEPQEFFPAGDEDRK
ncbi:unnamed protein product [Adineta ricciae]|uniref:Uncharacterized protein n=2 Tax=Adineta ricciae TaxID=249248 RepID=A0A813PAW8_ADIRI|nr:unnamed protein product [Adineta ricciae]